MNRSTFHSRCFVVVGFGWLLIAFMHAGYGSSFDHDEHQFIAPAYHIQDGLIPYRDFPLFHLPYQQYLFAGIVSISDVPMAALRRVSPWCAWLTVIVIVLTLRRQLNQHLALAAAVTALFAFHWTLPYTIGRTWNHASSCLAAVCAIAAVLRGTERGHLRWFALAGVMFGLAVGFRLTWAPLGAALVGGCFVGNQRRMLKAVVLLGATAIALLPVAWFAAQDWQAFWFGNFGYPALHYQAESLANHDMGVMHKLGSIVAKSLGTPAGAVLGILLAVTGIKAIALCRGGKREGFGVVVFAWAALLLTCIGSYAPAIIHRQYHYGPFAVAAIAAGVTVAYLIRHGDDIQRATKRLVPAATIVAFISLASYPSLLNTINVDGSKAYQFTSLSQRLAARLPAGGKVATITPTFAVITGLKCYPQLATGPFAWRTAFLLEASQRKAMHIVGPEDIDALLDADPPDAILVGLEKHEDPLRNWAQAHGYRPKSSFRYTILRCQAELWIRPR